MMSKRGKNRSCAARCAAAPCVFLVAMLLMIVDVAQAVFTPANRAALKAAVGTCDLNGGVTGGCLMETPSDGSCPIYSTGWPMASVDGPMPDWNTSFVTDMHSST